MANRIIDPAPLRDPVADKTGAMGNVWQRWIITLRDRVQELVSGKQDDLGTGLDGQYLGSDRTWQDLPDDIVHAPDGVLPPVNGGNITNIVEAALPDTVTLQGNEFNGSTQLIQTTDEGYFPPLNGSLITDISVSSLPDTVTVQGNEFNGPSQLVQLEGDGILPPLNGSQLTDLPAQQWDEITGKPYYTLSRTINAIKDSTVEYFSIPIDSLNSSNKVITIRCDDDGFESTVKFDVSNYINDTSGAWKLCYPVAVKDVFSSQTIGLEVWSDGTVVKFRARLLVEVT